MKISEVGFVYSEHYAHDNTVRERNIKSIGGDGTNIIAKFYWDRNHSEGAEWHWLTDNAVIIITNVDKCDGRYVTTKLVARPQQLLRYNEMGLKNELDKKTIRMKNWMVPQRVIGLARSHQMKGLNME